MKPKSNSKFHVFDSLFTFLLLLSFLLFSLLLCSIGSAVYRSGSDSLNENYTSRTALAYLAEKLREHDESGALSETSIGETTALLLSETIDGKVYVTYLYYYDGALCELFAAADTDPSPEMGTKIAKLRSFSFSWDEEHSLLLLKTQDASGVLQTLTLHNSCQVLHGAFKNGKEM